MTVPLSRSRSFAIPHLIRFTVSLPSHIPRRFRKLISSCRLGSSCHIVVICPLGSLASSSSSVLAPCHHRLSLVPLVRLARRGAWLGEVIRIVSSARRGQASRRADGRGHVVHVVRAGSVLIVERLVQSERTSGTSSSMSWCKQAGNGGGAMSSSLRLVRPSRGVRLVSSTLVRLVRRDVGRGVARCRSCGNVGKQAGGGGGG